MSDALLNHHTIVHGHRIATGVHGSGVPLVLVHGTPAHSIIWRRLVPRFVDAGLRVHLFDLLGFGASERPLDADTSIAAQLPVLRALLDHWQLDSTHVFGHDIGGALSLRLAIEDGRRLRSLTIADSVSYDSWPSPTWRAIRENCIEHALGDPDAHRETMTRQFKSAVADPARMSGELLERYLAPISGPVGQPAFFRHQVAHYDARHTADFATALPALRVPVHILWGGEDAWQPVRYAHRLHADIPGSTLRIVDGAGHFLMEDAPDVVAGEVVAYVRRSEAERA
ncbi:alpha/beta fold hydrolase [Coralloluteibacterium thermophilus]|uniref:Alpha/beta fold hydrolase n=1 Tax=Coralloluteibacterium thermophilum TaxID=2707049 RepID=A0ABV9NIJ9_9GAMM